jgi:hypothetical protein
MFSLSNFLLQIFKHLWLNANQTIADIHTDGQGQLSVFKNNFDVEFYIAIQL